MRSYKPDPAHFKECERRIGGKKGWVHVGVELLPRRRAVPEGEDPRDLGQPQQGAARLRARRSRPPRSRPSSRRPSCSAPPERACSAVGAPRRRRRRHVARSGRRRARSCAPARRRSCIDSPVLPGRARGCCRRSLEQAGFRVVGLLVTHADWDHLLGRYAFPDAPLGVRRDDRGAPARRAGRGAARAARLRRGALRRAPGPLSLPGAAGAAGARALRARRRASSSCTRPTATPPTAWRSGSRGRGVLVLRRLPLAGRDPVALARRLASTPTSRRCDRLEPLVEQADARRARPRRAARRASRAAAILREDRAYLEGAARRRRCPLARRTGAQKQHPRRERERRGSVGGMDPRPPVPPFTARHRRARRSRPPRTPGTPAIPRRWPAPTRRDSQWRNRDEFFAGPRGDRRVPDAQVGAGARLQADEGAVGVPRQPHLRALRVRVAATPTASGGARTATSTGEFDELGYMRRRDAVDQRSEDRRARAALPLPAAAFSGIAAAHEDAGVVAGSRASGRDPGPARCPRRCRARCRRQPRSRARSIAR